MHRNNRLIVFIILTSLIAGCVEEFKPNIDKYEELLVISGGITNEPGPYNISLSTTNSIYDNAQHYITGALLSILDENDNIEFLKEISEGKYQTINPDFRGEIGGQYKLRIELPEGKIYESDYQPLSPSPPIDSIYAEFETRATSSENYTREGLQFYLDTKNENPSSDYLLWRMSETYRFHSEYTIDYIFEGSVEENPDKTMYYWCFKTNTIPAIKTYSSQQATEPDVNRFPLIYVDTETRKLTVHYSLLVKQYAVSESAFHYWDEIIKQNEEQGSFYSRQPHQIRGNVYNVNDPDEPVVGFFIVAGVTEKRIFVYPPAGLKFYFPICYLNTRIMEHIFEYPPASYPIYLTGPSPEDLSSAGRECFDCRLRGGVLEKPDFWEVP